MRVLVTRTLLELSAAWEDFLGGREPVDVTPLAECPDVLAVTFEDGDEQQQESETVQPGQRSTTAPQGQMGPDQDDVLGQRHDPGTADRLP
jgi:hypothetical protein